MKERRRYPVDTVSEGLKVELSEDTKKIIRQLSDPQKPVPQLDRNQTQEIRNLRGFLNVADAGLQGLDFHNPQAPLNENRRLARDIALQALCHNLHPSDKSLSYDDAVLAHQRFMAIRNSLDSLVRELPISMQDRTLLSQSVGAFEEMQARIPPKPSS